MRTREQDNSKTPPPGFISQDEILRHVKTQYDIDISKHTLRSWQKKGFPKPKIFSSGRGQGVSGQYPVCFIDVIQIIVRGKENGKSLESAIRDALDQQEKEILGSIGILLCYLNNIYKIQKFILNKRKAMIDIENYAAQGMVSNYDKIIEIIEAIQTAEKEFLKYADLTSDRLIDLQNKRDRHEQGIKLLTSWLLNYAKDEDMFNLACEVDKLFEFSETDFPNHDKLQKMIKELEGYPASFNLVL